jgi:DNA-binding transcriptional ArsR family regulator
MTPGERPDVPASQRDLDPLLLLPVRLFVACLLADMRWCEDVAVRSALSLSRQSFAQHAESLRAAGYLETRTEGRRTKLRLTALGLDRLTEHVTALQTVAHTAAELVAAQRADLRPPIRPES